MENVMRKFLLIAFIIPALSLYAVDKQDVAVASVSASSSPTTSRHKRRLSVNIVLQQSQSVKLKLNRSTFARVGDDDKACFAGRQRTVYTPTSVTFHTPLGEAELKKMMEQHHIQPGEYCIVPDIDVPGQQQAEDALSSDSEVPTGADVAMEDAD